VASKATSSSGRSPTAHARSSSGRTPMRPSSRHTPSTTTAICANDRWTSIPIDLTSGSPLSSVGSRNRRAEATETDSRSRRSRVSRGGGQVLTRARSSMCRPACPSLIPPRRPGPDRQTLEPRSDDRPVTPECHTCYERDRSVEPTAAQSDQDERSLPQRAGRPQTHLPRHRQRRAGLDANAQLDDSPTRVQDPLRRPATRVSRLHRKSDALCRGARRAASRFSIVECRRSHSGQGVRLAAAATLRE
jgi:hypothetical protein